MHNVKPIRPLANGAFVENDNFPLCLAPMVGLTHIVQRKIIQAYMPKNASTFWPTEMLNSRRLPNETLGKSSETYAEADEVNLVPQLLGNDKKAINDSIHLLAQQWQVKGIDINMGCPVQKALRHNYGVALMGDSDYAAQVVRYAVEASQELEMLIPISVKLRAVEQSKDFTELLFFVEQLVKAGVSWITLHPRSPEQQRKGTADWSQIAKLKKSISVPVIGNGDIQVAEDVLKMLAETKADKVMAGRAFIARPWMAAQLGQKLGFEVDQILPTNPVEEGAEYGRMLQHYIELCDQYFMQKIKMSESLAMRRILFFVKTTHVWLQFGHTLHARLSRGQNLKHMQDIVSDFFSQEQIMVERTELRQ